MERIDDLQLSGLRIIQDTELFCFGMDAVLLSGFLKVKKGGRLLDMCSGNGIVALLASAKTEAARIDALEINPKNTSLAERSVQLNGLKDRVFITCGDVREAGDIYPPASFDVISCNPPYIPEGTGLTNPDDSKALARHELKMDFTDLVRAAEKLLKPKCSLFLVHKAERLPELFIKLSTGRLEPKRLRIVCPYVTHEPAMVLIEAVKYGNPGMKAEPPLIIYEPDGTYSAEMREKYGY